MSDIVVVLQNLAAQGQRIGYPTCDELERAANEIERLRRVLTLASQDLSLIVAKHAIGKDRTAVRMTKYLNAEKRKVQ